jgi:MFS family permease
MSANYEGVAASSKPPMLLDVVDSLGMGLAQIVVLITGPFGILMSEGILFTTLTSITTSVTTDLEVGEHDHGLLSTLAFVGLFIGVSSSGLIADVFGRRLIVLVSYVILIAGLILCAFLQDWNSIAFAGLLAGAGVGLGTPPSIALLSEITPLKWKIGMRGASGIGYGIGVAAVCMIAAQDDVSLQHLNWRVLFLKSGLPVIAMLVLAFALLPESPVFLASTGNRAEAEQSFRQLARRNGKHITGAYELPAKKTEMLSCSKQMRVVFSAERWFATLLATYGCFCMNLTQYGRAYASPIIFADTSSVPAAYEIAMGAIPGAVMNIMAAGVGDYFTRRTSIIVASTICWTAAWALIISGDMAKPRSFVWEATFQYGSLFGGVAPLWASAFSFRSLLKYIHHAPLPQELRLS